MTRIERLVESREAELCLSDNEAAALMATGRRLASDRTWLGVKPSEDRTVIRCMRGNRPGQWLVRVQDAVGIISIGELQVVIEPKIPTDHLLFLFSKAMVLPKFEDQPATAATPTALWELIAQWFVRSMMAVLGRGLTRDYQGVDDVLQTVRGRISSVPTARAYYSGRVEIHCAYDDFVADTPLNRLLRAAASEISRSALLSPEVRRDGRRILARLDDVGKFCHGDMAATVDRRTWYCRDAVVLARHILRCIGRTFLSGAETTWTFLIRTPELVESGIRQMVTEALDDMTVIKSSAPIVGATFGVHPDIVFGDGLAIADVKYKLAQEGWNRPDLYEVVAFAAAFRCFDAALICFSVDRLPPRTVGVGSTSVLRLAWNCGVSPDSASRTLCESISLWIRDVKQNHGTTGVILCAGTAQQLTVAKVQALARLPAE